MFLLFLGGVGFGVDSRSCKFRTHTLIHTELHTQLHTSTYIHANIHTYITISSMFFFSQWRFLIGVNFCACKFPAHTFTDTQTNKTRTNRQQATQLGH